jgi:hypothetical protein
MKTVRVAMSDEAYEKLRKESKRQKLPGVASLLLRKAGVLSDDALAADIVKKALTKAKKKEIGTVFRLKELFKEADWEAYPVGLRIRTGRQFQEATSGTKHPMLKALGKDDANHQTYERIF